MAPSTSMVGRLGLALLALASVFPTAAALDQKYCSTENTADGDGTASIYQSNGLCHDQCVDDYAFAVMTDNLCWCTNYIPATTVDRSECDSPCKGYDQEDCGGDGLYGYIRLNKIASGTKGLPSSTSSSKAQAITVTAPGTTITKLVTPTPSTSSTSTTSSPTKTSSSSSQATTTAPSSSSTSMTVASPYVSVVTESGLERIITVVPTQALPAETGKDVTSDNDTAEPSSKKLSTGASVGLAIGLVALAVIIGIIVFFLMRRKRLQRNAEALRSGSPGAPNSGIPSRTMSENSRYMLGTDGREVVGGWQQDGMNQPGNRRSRLMPVDPRLDPFAPVYQRGDGATSRDSVMSIRDDRDYSRRVVGGPVIAGSSSPPQRVLGVINP